MTVGSTNGRCVVRMGLAVVVSMAVLRVVAAEYFVDANRADTTDVIDGKTPETAFKTI